MQHFYDGQIRRYISQTIRALSNFVVKYGDGTLHRVPVMYGDADRQVASIIRNNSENKINSVPRISVYVNSLSLDRERLADSSYVGKVHIRERDFLTDSNGDPTRYTQGQGRNYTIERLMPTPFSLKMKVDIWSSSTDQKLQILEQILVLFNPSLELQTNDNYVDWTSLTVLNLNDINWSSRTVPVGSDTPIEVATLTVDTPIWLSPPAKVKHLGVITKIITSVFSSHSTSETYIDGLGIDPMEPTITLDQLLSRDAVTISDYQISVYNSQARLLGPSENVLPVGELLPEIPKRQGIPLDWLDLFDQYPGKYHAGSSQLFLQQPNGTYVVGTIAVNPTDPTILQVNWNPDTLVTNYLINSAGKIDVYDVEPSGYAAGPNYRPNSPGTFDAIVDPLTKGPRGSGLPDAVTGARYLLIEDIGWVDNEDGADAWKGDDGSELVAHANDIVEWDGTKWVVIFDSTQEQDIMVWQTNIYTGVQYLWNGVSWVKSFEGEYKPGQWKLIL